MPGSVLKAWNPLTSTWDVVLVGKQGPQGTPGTPGAGGALGYYGSFYDTTTQVAVSTTVAYPLEINSTSEANGVSITNDLSGNPTQITFQYDGTYSIVFSAQFTNDSGSEGHTSIWLRLNGTDIPVSRSQWTIPKSHAGDPGSVVGTVEFTQTFDAGDDVQLIWQTDLLDVEISTLPAGVTPVSPVSPGLIVSVAQVMYTQVGPQGPVGPAGAAGATVLELQVFS